MNQGKGQVRIPPNLGTLPEEIAGQLVRKVRSWTAPEVQDEEMNQEARRLVYTLPSISPFSPVY